MRTKRQIRMFSILVHYRDLLTLGMSQMFMVRKGTLMRFTPPMFGTIDSRSANGLPAGLSFNVATGEISGTPVGGSSSDVSITLTGRGVTTTKVFKVQVVDLDAYAYKVQVTPSGYAGSETLRDFPALIRLSVAGVNGFSYNSFLAKDLEGKSTGYDLRAFDANGRILPYEIENWDPEGVSEIWVRTYDLNTSNAITLAWGNSAETDIEPYTYDGSVWTNNFAGVYHMNKAVLGKQTDSAPNANHATDTGFVDGNSTLEVAGPFRSQGPSSTGGMNAPSGALNSVQAGSYTLSGWIRRTQNPGAIRNAFLARGYYRGPNHARANNFNSFWTDTTRQGQRIFNDQDLYINQDAEFIAAGVGINRNDNFPSLLLQLLWCLKQEIINLKWNGRMTVPLLSLTMIVIMSLNQPQTICTDLIQIVIGSQPSFH